MKGFFPLVLLLCLMLIAMTLVPVAITAKECDNAETGSSLATVSLYAFGEKCASKTFNVGEEFTVYTLLDTSANDDGNVSVVSGEQQYTSSVLQIADQLDEDSILINIINGRDCVFPVMSDMAIGYCGKDGVIYFSGSNPSKRSPFVFVDDYQYFYRHNSVQYTYQRNMMVTTYKVTAPGSAIINTNINTLALIDDDLTRIVNRYKVQRGYSIKFGTSFSEEGELILFEGSVMTSYDKLSDNYLGDVDGNGVTDIIDVAFTQRYIGKVMVPRRVVDRIETIGDIDGDGEVTSVDASYIQRYITHLPVSYNIGGAIEEEAPTVKPSEKPTVEPTDKPTEDNPKLYNLGDIDNDDDITAVDATYTQRFATMIKVPYSDDYMMERGDVDNDGDVTVVDATYILRFSTHITVPVPVGEYV